jgi:short subunit dehydrogenase-like uncharacterized protein
MARDLDLVVFGATGFVGRLTAEYLARAAPPQARIGLAGRSRDRLEAVRAGLGPRAADWPLLVADTGDPEALRTLAESTTAVATTVGPYARYGLPLVRACAEAGTHYADLTGEVLFVRQSIDAAEVTARGTGARIVHACGFDSIPSDLGVLMAAEQARADGAGELTDTTLLVLSMRGGASGGTIDSVRGMIDEARTSPAARRLLLDPYSLSPDRAAEPDLGSERDSLAVTRADGRWTAPFVMASFNTRIVRRSNALTGWRYGRGFRYREVMGVGRSPAAPLLAGAVAAGVGGLLAGMALPPTRFVLDRVLPKPGQGPSEKARENGYFRIRVTASTTSGARYRTTVAAKGDPGYAATAVMLGEAGLALALDDLPPAAGVLTPATGIGLPLVDRLRAAGFTMTTERLAAGS